MSLIGNSGKSYGLNVKKETKTTFSKPSVFDCDSDSEGEDRPNLSIRSLQAKHSTKAAKQIQQVLEAQPDIYQYDEVYDEMEDSRMHRRQRMQASAKQSKYVSLIKDMSSGREREWERRQERKYQTEREKEGDLYNDKDSYTTPGYKKYLEDRKEDDEKELERERQEELLDVSKQKSLSLFYSHLLTDNVAMGGKPTDPEHCKKDTNEEIEKKPSIATASEESDQTSTQKSKEIETVCETGGSEEESVLEKKVDVFAKRTTEEMRLAALERYLQRKAKRLDLLQTANV